jgi:glutamate-1-semialdehyde 2,1-aminomutase
VTAVDRLRLASLMEREEQRFARAHPRSRELHERARRALPGGVPMHWMTKWASPFPVFVESARGAHFRDVDGHEYVDLCLGDTGAMTGHGPEATLAAVRRQLERGITHMLPTDEAAAAAELLAARFGLPAWQFTLSATDANRFALRLARAITRRPKILVFDYCYHGTVDETFATLRDDGSVGPRRGNIGPAVDPAITTRVVEFNDVDALDQALAAGDVAAVLAEPALTNIGIVLPEPGFHEALRRLTREHGTLLILDETHTLCAGPGGYTGEHHLAPDMLVVGKAIGGGIPSGAYGFTAEIAARLTTLTTLEDIDVGGIGGTLAGNALSLAAIHATLEQVLTPEAYSHMVPLAQRWSEGVERVLEAHAVPWHVTRLGTRAEYHFLPDAPRNGRQAAAASDFELERYLHLAALNRGILLTPFHNMALMSPATTADDVDRHTAAFEETIAQLVGAA